MLDNPIWSSLASLHRKHAIPGGEALRYPADIAPFLGVPREGAAAPLDELVGQEEVFMVGPAPKVSAVCTHPDFVGRGLARHLLAFLSNDILKGGALPFLHVSPKNERALELYRRNGYRVRAEPRFSALRR